MKITTDHSASSYGVPVVLDDGGAPLDYAPGVRAARERLGLDRDQLATLCGVSRRTVEGWEAGRMPTVAALNVIAGLLNKPERTRETRR